MDLVTHRYLHQAVAAGEALGLFGSYAGIKSRILRNVYAVTAWGLYGFQG